MSVHNKFLFTFHCISSILNCIDVVPYEIILANDMSIDETQFIDKYIKNINIINNDKKYNFILNCNRASKYAKGKYIIFLNNDTKVNKEWLISLFKLIESDNNIILNENPIPDSEFKTQLFAYGLIKKEKMINLNTKIIYKEYKSYKSKINANKRNIVTNTQKNYKTKQTISL